jgi:hypothetical protein
MCDEKPWQLVTKKSGNSNENLCQDQIYDADVVCAVQNHAWDYLIALFNRIRGGV